MTGAGKDTLVKGKRSCTVLFFSAYFIYYAVYCVFSSFIVLFLTEQGYSATVCGIITSLTFLANLLMEPVGGYITDTFLPTRRYLLVCIGIVSMVCAFCTKFMDQSWLLLPGLVLAAGLKAMALIYIVEDDESIREIETIALKNSNYIVSAFENAKEFYKKLDELVPDLILLDVMLPDESGYDIVRKLRKRPATQDIPIIMVTAKTTEMDMIKGLDGGADDYIKKPFSIMELITRVKALLRRTVKEEPKLLKLDDLVIDHERHVVTVNNEPVDLTYKEYELLRLLMGSQGIVMTREVIMRSVWDTDFEGETRTVDMHIKTLRHKLGDYGSRIKTVRNVGYVIE